MFLLVRAEMRASAVAPGLRQAAAPALAAAALAFAQSLHHADAPEADAKYLAKLKAVTSGNVDKSSHAAAHPFVASASTRSALTGSVPHVSAGRAHARKHGLVVDVASINAAVRASSELRRVKELSAPAASLEQTAKGVPEELGAHGTSGGKSPVIATDTAHTEAAYLQTLQKGLIGQRPQAKIAPNAVPTEIRSLQDCETIHREVCIVALTRAAHPALAAALQRTLAATAAEDELGFTYYLITDSTPADVVEKLEKGLHAEIPGTYDEWRNGSAQDSRGYSAAELQEGAVPVIALFDRAASTQRKFFCPPVVHTDEVPAAITSMSSSSSASASSAAVSLARMQESVTSDIPMAVQLLLASTPYPSELSAWSTSFAYGELRPTLLGVPRPTGDYLPGHAPYVTQVTSEAWYDVVLDPHTDVLLEAYLSHCPMCMCLAPRLRMLGYLLHKYGPRQATSDAQPLVKVAVMNVDENERPTDWMPGPAFPTIQLFTASEQASQASSSSIAHTHANAKDSDKDRGVSRVPWTKAHGPGCGHAAGPAMQVLRKYGVVAGNTSSHESEREPRSSTQEVANAGGAATGAAAPAGAVGGGESSYLSSLLQGRLPSLYPSAQPQGSASTPSKGYRAASVEEHPRPANPYAHRLTGKGTPPCVPSMDFTHPTQPHKSALPSVTDLLWWVAAHCSASADAGGPGSGSSGFDPSSVRVPASELRHSRERMVELGMLPASSLPSKQAEQQGEKTVSLLELAADMDGESRAYEGAVFDSFYYTSMLNAYKKACYGGAEGGEGGEAAAELPPTFSCPLPAYTAASARAKLPLFTALLDQLKAVAVEGGTYGRLEETVHALDALAEFAGTYCCSY